MRYPKPGLQCSWCCFLCENLRSSGCGPLRLAWTMQPALLLLFLLPPPSPGAFRLAGRDGTRARCAADRRETAVMQGIAGNAVLADEREHPLARPVEQRIYLDQPVMRIDRSKGDAGALVRLIRAQTRDPRGGACEGALEWLDLAYRAARAPRFERGVKPLDALAADQRFNTYAIGIERRNSPAISVFRLRPDLIGLRKQTSGIERHHLNPGGLLKYRMRDYLVLDTEARGEYDPAMQETADCRDTLHHVAIEAHLRNRPVKLVAFCGLRAMFFRRYGNRTGAVLEKFVCIQSFLLICG